MTDDVQHLIEFLSLPPHAVLEGDCLERVRRLPDNSVDAIVTDPPYGLSAEPDMAEVMRHWLAGDDYQHRGSGFMGKKWDSFVPGPTVWREALRVLKPGGHVVAFYGTRTYDMGVLAMRLAGFEIRDQLAWVFGSGFPKSLDVSKAIDKAAGTWRGRRGPATSENGAMAGPNYARTPKGEPATPEAARWEGWGTALKPAYEPIVLARKPFPSTVAANVLAHGTGALNIDGCRVAAPGETISNHGESGGSVPSSFALGAREAMQTSGQVLGRWPANLAHDGSDDVLAGFPDSGGSAARFFYCAKASRADRDEGLEAFQLRAAGEAPGRADGSLGGEVPQGRNTHPTVKPTALMRWLVRLVTPPGGLVLDPFTGSGSTGKACKLEGFRFVGFELDPDYAAIARARIEGAKP